MAQSVVFSNPSAPFVPRFIQKNTPAETTSASSTQEDEASTPIAFGRFRIRPELQVRYLQANGLPQGPGTTIDTNITTVTAGLTAELGEHWILNFAPTWVNYSDIRMRDSVNQSFKLKGATAIDDWTLQFSESLQTSIDVLAETAEQTKQRSWATVISGVRKLGNRSSYEGTASLKERYTDKFPDTKTWSTQQWLKTQLSPKVNAGLGLDLGYVDIVKQADMKYEQYLAQLNWKATDKLNVSIQGGLENRHSQAANTKTLHNPTLQASLGYKPLEHTRITITHSRSVSNSYFTDELVKNQEWSLALNQRLLGKLILDLNYSSQKNDYLTFGGITGRTANLNSFNSTLSVQVFKYWTVSAIYQSSKNTSPPLLGQQDFRYSTTQYGLEFRGSL